MMQKNAPKMTETLAHGYSSESTQRDLSNEYHQGLDGFQNCLHSRALEESSLSIRSVKGDNLGWTEFLSLAKHGH